MPEKFEEFISNEIPVEEETIVQEDEGENENIKTAKKDTSAFLKQCMTNYRDENPYS